MSDYIDFNKFGVDFPGPNYNFYTNSSECARGSVNTGCIRWECDGIVSKNTCAGNMYCAQYYCKKT